jgi:hypothetical protein
MNDESERVYQKTSSKEPVTHETHEKKSIEKRSPERFIKPISSDFSRNRLEK